MIHNNFIPVGIATLLDKVLKLCSFFCDSVGGGTKSSVSDIDGISDISSVKSLDAGADKISCKILKWGRVVELVV